MDSSLSGRRLLVLGGSRQAAEGLRQLKELGLEIVLCDFDLKAPGMAFANHFIDASVYHVEDCLPKVTAFHEQRPLDGVMCLACDVPHVVARLAAELGLPGLPIEVADRAIDKLAMKRKFALNGIAIPKFWEVESVAQLAALQTHEAGHLVVKPVDSRGSKGVSRLSASGSADWAFEYARENSPTGRVMAEQYLDGPQVSTESVVINGVAVTPALSDRSYEFLDRYYPFIVENGGDMPSSLPDATVDAIRNLVNAAAASLGITNGVVKGDIVVHNNEPHVIELAARLSGGYYCTHQIPLSTGVHLVQACARQALGESLHSEDWQAKRSDHVSTRWKMVAPGRVVEVPNCAEIMNMPGVCVFEHWLSAGDIIQEAQNAAASVAMVQAVGATTAEAVARAEAALAAFTPKIEPTS